MSEKISYVIDGGVSLKGEVRLSGAKNSALRLLAASILTNQKVTLIGCPSELQDSRVHIAMLKALGKEVNIEGDYVEISEPNGLKTELTWNGPSIRNTLLIAGALFARFGKAKVPFPGGCKLGDRKIDLHLELIQRLGGRLISSETHIIIERAKEVTGKIDFKLPIRSTGATENALLMASFSRVHLKLMNPHVRPEITDLIHFLKKMGASIEINGQDSFEIKGSEQRIARLHHEVIADNVEAITWLIAAIITRGNVVIPNFPMDHLEMPMIHLLEGQSFLQYKDGVLRIDGQGATSFELATGPYPGINSDMQALFAAYALQAEGVSRIIDLRFKDRFQYVQELKKMGADLEVDKNVLTINGGNQLKAADISATDIRGGMAMVLAALIAHDSTKISNMYQVERGYENLDEKLRSLGVNVSRYVE